MESMFAVNDESPDCSKPQFEQAEREEAARSAPSLESFSRWSG